MFCIISCTVLYVLCPVIRAIACQLSPLVKKARPASRCTFCSACPVHLSRLTAEAAADARRTALGASPQTPAFGGLRPHPPFRSPRGKRSSGTSKKYPAKSIAGYVRLWQSNAPTKPNRVPKIRALWNRCVARLFLSLRQQLYTKKPRLSIPYLIFYLAFFIIVLFSRRVNT